MLAESAISLNNVNIFSDKKKSTPILCEVTFDVPKGSSFAILGLKQNEADSLTALLSDKLAHYEGECKVLGQPQAGKAKWYRKPQTGKVAVLSGNSKLPPRKSLVRILRAIFRKDGDDLAVASDKTKQLLESAGLTAEAQKWYSQLLILQKLKFDYCLALAKDSQILIVDEVNSKPETVECVELLNMLSVECKKTGRSLALITGDLILAQRFCDRFVQFEDGRIRVGGPILLLGIQIAAAEGLSGIRVANPAIPLNMQAQSTEVKEVDYSFAAALSANGDAKLTKVPADAGQGVETDESAATPAKIIVFDPKKD